MWTWLYRLANFLVGIVLFAVYPRKLNGSGNMPADGPVIIVCNHRRFHDIFTVATSFRRRVVFMAKKELYKNPFVAFLFRKYGSFMVDRQAADISAIRTAVEILKQGAALVVFPEGTRQRDGSNDLGAIKKGAVLIAQKAGAQILPMYINNSERFFRPMTVNVGRPFALDETSRLDSAYFERMAEKIRESMLTLRTGAHGGGQGARV